MFPVRFCRSSHYHVGRRFSNEVLIRRCQYRMFCNTRLNGKGLIIGRFLVIVRRYRLYLTQGIVNCAIRFLFTFLNNECVKAFRINSTSVVQFANGIVVNRRSRLSKGARDRLVFRLFEHRPSNRYLKFFLCFTQRRFHRDHFLLIRVIGRRLRLNTILKRVIYFTTRRNVLTFTSTMCFLDRRLNRLNAKIKRRCFFHRGAT